MWIFLTSILPWIWLGLGALTAFLSWRGNQRALPLVGAFLLLGVGDLASTWMARHYIANLWLDRAVFLGVTGVLTGVILPQEARWRWLALLGVWAISGMSTTFGLATPIGIFLLIGYCVWQNFLYRLRGCIRGGVWSLVGATGWAWVAVIRVFSDAVLKGFPGMFLQYWFWMNLAAVIVMGFMVWGAYADNSAE